MNGISTQKVAEKLISLDFFSPNKSRIKFFGEKKIHLKYSLFQIEMCAPVINIMKYLFGLLHIMSQSIYIYVLNNYIFGY